MDNEQYASPQQDYRFADHLRQAQICRNLAACLESAGSDLGKVIKVNVYLTSMDDFDAMNEAYMRFFEDPKPVS